MKGETAVKGLLLAAAILLIDCSLYAQTDESGSPLLKGPYLGQKPPGITPEVFAPGVVSTSAHEFSCSFTPDGKEFYFARRDPNLNYPVVMATKLVDGTWTKPEIAPFGEQLFIVPGTRLAGQGEDVKGERPRCFPVPQSPEGVAGRPLPAQEVLKVLKGALQPVLIDRIAPARGVDDGQGGITGQERRGLPRVGPGGHRPQGRFALHLSP